MSMGRDETSKIRPVKMAIHMAEKISLDPYITPYTKITPDGGERLKISFKKNLIKNLNRNI